MIEESASVHAIKVDLSVSYCRYRKGWIRTRYELFLGRFFRVVRGSGLEDNASLQM